MGANGKEHYYPDYAPPKIELHYCLWCSHKWEIPFNLPNNWYYNSGLNNMIIYTRASFLPKRAYWWIIDHVDYQTKEYKSCFR